MDVFGWQIVVNNQLCKWPAKNAEISGNSESSDLKYSLSEAILNIVVQKNRFLLRWIDWSTYLQASESPTRMYGESREERFTTKRG